MSSMKSTFTKLFCLESLFLDRVESKKESIYLHVRSSRTVAICPHCMASSKKIHHRSKRILKHMICDDKLVYLHLTVRSFKCPDCRVIYCEEFDGVDRRQTTEHFRQKVVPKIRDRSFRAVAKEHRISSSLLMQATRDLKEKIGILWPKESFVLGIDGHSFAGRDFMITITDLTHRKLLTILPNNKQVTLKRFLANIPKKTAKLVTGVCIDMDQEYKAASEQILEGIPITVDKFHVVQHCNQHLHELRRIHTSHQFPLPKQLLEKNKEDLSEREEKSLQIIFRQYPPIEELWRLKEFVRTMYRLKDTEKAKGRYQALLDGLEGDPRPRWQAIHRTFRRWQPYILNYFESRITNAYTEGVHTRLKLLKRISYGFRNRFNYIAKMSIAFLPLTIIVQQLNSSTCLT